MKHILFSIVLAVISSAAVASPPHGGRVMDELDLTEDQREQMREIRENGGTREDIDAVLTEDQREKLDEMRRSRSEDRARRSGYRKS